MCWHDCTVTLQCDGAAKNFCLSRQEKGFRIGWIQVHESWLRSMDTNGVLAAFRNQMQKVHERIEQSYTDGYFDECFLLLTSVHFHFPVSRNVIT
jgi:hypothetical protein